MNQRPTLGVIPQTGEPHYLTAEQWRALGAVAAAMEHQNRKWGIQNHNPGHWFVILGEEVGEVARSIFDISIRPKDDVTEMSKARDNYRLELSQVAAVAADALATHYRNPVY